MAVINKDVVLVVSLVLSVVSLVLLFGVTWHFQSSLDLLQQQVEYDRELLFKLQEQINGKHDLNKHDVVKRQSEQNCQCKDGIPGPRGPPGNKGEIGLKGLKGDTGHPGPRGDAGDRGPRGMIGDPGYPGPPGQTGTRGQKGDTGDSGQRGDPGDRGPRGLVGNRGIVGQHGIKGTQGDQGQKGIKGEMGYQGLKGGKGEKGDIGSIGSTGLNGPKGAPGQKGMKGDKEKRNGGTVYVRWGHDQCPSTAQLVYTGRVGGSDHAHKGGGSNPQCLPLDPNFLKEISGVQYRALMFGAEYQTDTYSNSYIHGRHDTDIPCAVCHVSNRTAVYMVPAKYTCPTGWIREYYGYLMTDYYKHHRSQFTCVDTALKPVTGSLANLNGLLFYFVEGRCGSLPCPPYDNAKELSCAVCTK